MDAIAKRGFPAGLLRKNGDRKTAYQEHLSAEIEDGIWSFWWNIQIGWKNSGREKRTGRESFSIAAGLRRI